jgi:hypothetical protein
MSDINSSNNNNTTLGANVMKSQLINRFAIATVLAAGASPVMGHLAGFEQADGYNINVSSGLLNWCDVSYYNAGANGANSGGGALMSIAPNAGLWKIQSSPGGFYDTAANRAFYTGTAPPYPSSSSAAGTTYPIYIVGNHFGGRGGTTALALRNDNQGTGPIQYDYTLDNFDFNGVAPASVTSGTVTTSFYYCPNPVDPGPQDKFIMSFKDSSASTGLQIGYERNNVVQWRAGSSGAWNVTSIVANSTNYDGWNVNVNLSAQTFDLSYYAVATNTTSTIATGVPLGNPMSNLTHIGWWLTDSVSSGIGGKNFFDDFKFTVPEPSSATVLMIAGAALLARRRR